MKKIMSIFTIAVLAVTTFAIPKTAQNKADSAKAAETKKYTVEDIRNLQDFLLGKETPDLSGKDYDLCKDGV